MTLPRSAGDVLDRHLGFPVASTVVLAPISEAFVIAIKTFAAQRQTSMVDFVKGQRKDDVTQQYLAGFDRDEGVLFIGRA